MPIASGEGERAAATTATRRYAMGLTGRLCLGGVVTGDSCGRTIELTGPAAIPVCGTNAE
jgi:hypothetical protein